MAESKIINGNVYKYASIEEALLSSTRITNLKTGESVKLIGNAKLAYMILRKRFHLFTDQSTDNKYYTTGKHYDTIESIAEAIGVSDVGTVSSAIGRMEAAGLLTKKKFGKTYEWTVIDLSPELFLLERNTGTTKKSVWVDCLKHPVFGNAKEDMPAVQQEEQGEEANADPMCELEEAPEEEAQTPEKVKPTPKPKIKKPVTPSAAPSDDKEYSTKLLQFESAGHWYQFSEYQLPDLERFKRDGKLTNEYALAYLDKHTSQQTMNTQ
ncbi:DUF6945 domain-containing protein [Leclercia sp. GLN_9]|uniref:DUF6945 domain-containing protein n=1 Tax=Leclercia sp. GLN_9 TaxID=3367184 RepID=UPI00370CFB69